MIETTDQAPGATATATWATTLDGEPITGTVTVTKGTTPPPPPISTLSGLMVDKPSLQVGEEVMGKVTRTGPFDLALVVNLTAVGVTVPPTATIGPGVSSANFPFRGVTAGAGSITASAGTNTRAASVTVTPKPTPTRINVRDYGASGGGLVDDTPAIQRALAAASAGKEVYFPTGSYLLGSGLSVQTSGVTLTGDGDSTILNHGKRAGIHLFGAMPGAPVQDFVIQGLQFVGAPGVWAAGGNDAAHTLLLDGAKNTTVRNVTFTGCAHCVYEVNHAQDVLVEGCRMIGWGRVALGLGDGAIIRNNVMTQNHPDPTNRSQTYAIYPHNSCKRVLIEGNKISGVGSYAIHYWAQADIGPGGPMTIRDNVITDCWMGLFIGSGDGNVGRLKGVTIQRNTWRGPVKGANVNLKNGDDVLFEGNLIESGVDPQMMLDKIGLAIGMWGPGDSNGLLTNAVIRNNRVSGFDIGIYALSTATGRFVACQLGPGNIATGNRRDQIVNAPSGGLVVAP